MGRKLYVGNLPYSVTEDELRELFTRAGADTKDARAGADTFVAGTALFRQRNMRAAVKKMRQIANAHDPALADLKV